MITTPTLLLNQAQCKTNIRTMVGKARRLSLDFRPHFKTHVSAEIGEWFRQEGVEKITVSSLSMARYFADAGWQDITVAFPVNIREIDTINELAGRIRLNLLLESVEVVDFLAKHLKHSLAAFIKIDIGNARAGIQPENTALIDAVLAAMETSGRLQFAGFLGHAGQTYAARGPEEIRQVHAQSLLPMQELKARYQAAYPKLQISVGDTPGCSQVEDFAGVDEIRPGNFVFYDLMQTQIGSNGIDQVAVAMACPLVAIHPDRNELVIYGGSVHFAKDSMKVDGKEVYGQLVEGSGLSWGKPIEGAYIRKLSQEHGIVHAPDSFIRQCKPGDLIYVLPVHSCTTANLMREYLTEEGKIIRRM